MLSDGVKLVYIAGPYRNPDPWLCEQNMREAEAVGYRVACCGAYPIIPHSNTRPYFGSAATDAFWLAGTLQLMRVCHAVMLLPRWEESTGARAEHDEAVRLGMPLFRVAQLDGYAFRVWALGEGAAP